MSHEFEDTQILFVAIQEPDSRRWMPVGRLCFGDDSYWFDYTRGALRAHEERYFEPFSMMPDFDEVYMSESLFPMFKNRVMPKSRPEYGRYAHWLGVGVGSLTPLVELGRSGGARVTDNIELIAVPRNLDGRYSTSFFARGVRELPEHVVESVGGNSVGSRLRLSTASVYTGDPDTLAMYLESPSEIIGFCPPLLGVELARVSCESSDALLTLAQVNTDAPNQLRYRCEFTAEWPPEFVPFHEEDFRSIVGMVMPV